MSTSSTDIRGQAEESAKKPVMDSRTAAHGRVQRPRAGEEHPWTGHRSLLGTVEGLMGLPDAVLNFFRCKTSPTASIWDNSLRAVSLCILHGLGVKPIGWCKGALLLSTCMTIYPHVQTPHTLYITYEKMGEFSKWGISFDQTLPGRPYFSLPFLGKWSMIRHIC